MNPNEYTIYEWVNGTYTYYINIGQALIGYDDPPNYHVIDGVMFDDVKDELIIVGTHVSTDMDSARLMVQLIRAERTPLSLYYAKALLLEAGMSYNYITPDINGVNEQGLQDVRLMQLAHADPTKVMVYLIPITPEYP